MPSSPRSPRAACVLRGSLLLLRVFVQPRALHGLLAAEQRDLLQRRVELVRLALEVVQRVDVHVHHLDELRQPGRLPAARLGLPLRVELLDALGELLARLAQLGVEVLGELVGLLPLARPLEVAEVARLLLDLGCG